MLLSSVVPLWSHVRKGKKGKGFISCGFYACGDDGFQRASLASVAHWVLSWHTAVNNVSKLHAFVCSVVYSCQLIVTHLIPGYSRRSAEGGSQAEGVREQLASIFSLWRLRWCLCNTRQLWGTNLRYGILTRERFFRALCKSEFGKLNFAFKIEWGSNLGTKTKSSASHLARCSKFWKSTTFTPNCLAMK